MSTTYYPKILIVGQSFNLQSGGGITLTNLFYGWDKNNIAVAAETIGNPGFEVCKKYYQLGSLEIGRRFPFNLNPWSDYIVSGIITRKEVSDSLSLVSNKKKSIIKIVYEKVLDFTGLVHYNHKYKISDKFLQWIKNFSPDIIYSQLSSLELIRLVNDLHKQLKFPVAIHIMDDWPCTICKGYFSKLMWQKTINKEFLNLLSDSKFLFSIREAMSEEYLKRYCLKFIPFHNPIDLKFHSLIYKKNYELNGPFTILYSGRIGLGIKNCLLEIADAIKSLTLKGFKIEFHIPYTIYKIQPYT